MLFLPQGRDRIRTARYFKEARIANMRASGRNDCAQDAICETSTR